MSKSKHKIGPVRFSFVRVFQPERSRLNEGKLEYSVTCLIPKVPTAQCPDPESVRKALVEHCKEAAHAKWGAKLPAGMRSPLRDGDTELDDDGKPRQPGCWYFRCASGEKFPPVVVDGDRKPVTDRDGWESGDWGNVLVTIFPWEKAGNKGLAIGLEGVQFTHGDEHFSGGRATAEDFEVVGVQGRVAKAIAEEFDPFEDQ